MMDFCLKHIHTWEKSPIEYLMFMVKRVSSCFIPMFILYPIVLFPIQSISTQFESVHTQTPVYSYPSQYTLIQNTPQTTTWEDVDCCRVSRLKWLRYRQNSVLYTSDLLNINTK